MRVAVKCIYVTLKSFGAEGPNYVKKRKERRREEGRREGRRRKKEGNRFLSIVQLYILIVLSVFSIVL